MGTILGSNFLLKGARFWSLNFCAGGTKIKVFSKFFKKRGTILTKKDIGALIFVQGA